MRVNPTRIAKWGVILLWPSIFFLSIGHFRVPKTLTFKMRPSPQSFLWKWVLFAWEWKIISISKAEHLTSFWYRGPGELGTGIIYYQFGRPQLPSNKARCKQNCNNHGPVVLAVANYNIFKMAIILDLVLIKIIIHI